MITVTVERKKGACTTRIKVSAESIERAVEIAGRGADSSRLLCPINGEEFFARPTDGERCREHGTLIAAAVAAAA